jgi:hypothetical protein
MMDKQYIWKRSSALARRIAGRLLVVRDSHEKPTSRTASGRDTGYVGRMLYAKLDMNLTCCSMLIAKNISSNR